MNQYFVAEPGKSPQGPYAEAMVQSAFEQGMYPPGTKVWWEGATQWELVELVFGKGISHAVPPPLPVALPPAPPVHQNPQPEPVTMPQKAGTASVGEVLGIVFGGLISLFVFVCFSMVRTKQIKFRGDFSMESIMWVVGTVFIILALIYVICEGIRKAYKFIRKWM